MSANNRYHPAQGLPHPVPVNRAIVAIIGLAVASPLIAVALNAAGVGPGFEVDAPEWSPGHNWHYDLTMTARARGQIFGVAEGETPQLQVDMARGFEVINTDLREASIPLQAALQTATLHKVMLGNDVLYDHQDPDAAAEDWDHSGGDMMMEEEMLCLDRCETGILLVTKELNPFLSDQPFDDTREGPETLDLFDFPLTQDKTWTVLSFQEDDFLFEIQATAAEQEYINPDGMDPLQTIRIEAGLTDASRDSLKRMIQQEAQNEDVQLDLDFDLDFTYWYAPKVENIVKFVADGFVAGRGAGYGAAGAFRIDMKLVEELDAYDLAVKPARDIGDAERLADAARRTGSDAGLSATPFDFELGVNERHLNAADGATVKATLHTADGAAAQVPGDARIEWTYTDPNGVSRPIEGAESASQVIGQPGIHTLTARAYDQHDLLMGADAILIEAYTDERITLEPVAVAPLAKQLHTAFEIAPGASIVTASVETDGAAFGTLTIEGPSGHATTGGVRSEPATIELPEPGIWTATWDETAHAGATDLHFVVRYALDDGAETYETVDGGMTPEWLRVQEPLAGIL